MWGAMEGQCQRQLMLSSGCRSVVPTSEFFRSINIERESRGQRFACPLALASRSSAYMAGAERESAPRTVGEA